MIAIGAAAIWFAKDFSSLGSVFPLAVGGLLVALGLLYIVLVLLGRTRRAASGGGSDLRRTAVAVVMLGWAFTLDRIGFLPSSVAAFAALLVIANHERWSARTVLLYGGAGVLVLGGLYALFKHALLVPLP